MQDSGRGRKFGSSCRRGPKLSQQNRIDECSHAKSDTDWRLGICEVG